MNGSENSIEPFIDKLIVGDALKIMRTMPANSIGLIFTSPPYNIKNSTGNGLKNGKGGKWSNAQLLNGYQDYGDCLPHAQYVKWQRECLSEMLRLISEDGAIFYNHKWRVQSGLLQDRQDIIVGFPVRQIIIWKRNGGINFNPGYFLPTYEVIYLIAKPAFRLLPGANANGDLWEIGQERNNSHPAPFPLALAERVISSTGAKIVLDPFVGSGTTALAAKRLDRQYIGIDQTPEYIEMAAARLANYTPKGPLD